MNYPLNYHGRPNYTPKPENQILFTLNFQYQTNYPPQSNPERFCPTWRTRGNPVSIF